MMKTAIRRISFRKAAKQRDSYEPQEEDISKLFEKKCLTREESQRIRRAMAGGVDPPPAQRLFFLPGSEQSGAAEFTADEAAWRCDFDGGVECRDEDDAAAPARGKDGPASPVAVDDFIAMTRAKDSAPLPRAGGDAGAEKRQSWRPPPPPKRQPTAEEDAAEERDTAAAIAAVAEQIARLEALEAAADAAAAAVAAREQTLEAVHAREQSRPLGGGGTVAAAAACPAGGRVALLALERDGTTVSEPVQVLVEYDNGLADVVYLRDGTKATVYQTQLLAAPAPTADGAPPAAADSGLDGADADAADATVAPAAPAVAAAPKARLPPPPPRRDSLAHDKPLPSPARRAAIVDDADGATAASRLREKPPPPPSRRSSGGEAAPRSSDADCATSRDEVCDDTDAQDDARDDDARDDDARGAPVPPLPAAGPLRSDGAPPAPPEESPPRTAAPPPPPRRRAAARVPTKARTLTEFGIIPTSVFEL
ncbi:hypothetical protein M885DRAFT_505042 [Pelagophyceae sp. CCMP2097]|nr:hypothetical protein M885DRAFT_505042 [Pelagophyceae sp. CCMP2097]